MNEQKLVDWLRRAFRVFPPVRNGIGDDAAVIRLDKRRDLLLKADMIVEDVHFDARTSKEADWGRKAILCNVSDIAAMGGIPRFALVSLGLPRRTRLEKAKRIARGIREACSDWGIQLVGGDTSRSARVVISVALVGDVEKGKAVLRSGAKPGDVLFVTGKLGGSLGSKRHLRFVPRVPEARYLAAHYPVRAMIDVSDGLSRDLKHLARESGVGLRIFEASVPLNRGVPSVKAAFLDGEDFELVFTLRVGEAVRLIKDARARRKGFVFYPFGRVVNPRFGCRMVTLEGREVPFPPAKDHHFGR